MTLYWSILYRFHTVWYVDMRGGARTPVERFWDKRYTSFMDILKGYDTQFTPAETKAPVRKERGGFLSRIMSALRSDDPLTLRDISLLIAISALSLTLAFMLAFNIKPSDLAFWQKKSGSISNGTSALPGNEEFGVPAGR